MSLSGVTRIGIVDNIVSMSGFTSVEESMEAPEFIEVPQSMSVTKGSLASFACKAKGKPTPRITWYKDGRPMRLHSLISLITKPDEAKLEISSEMKLSEVVPLMNDGKYTIEASNDAGTVTHEIELVGETLLLCVITTVYFNTLQTIICYRDFLLNIRLPITLFVLSSIWSHSSLQ